MEILLIYNLKLSICFAVFYILYKLLFSKETFYRTNRLVLMGICTFTLIIPAITIDVNKEDVILGKIHSLQQTVAYTPETNIIVTNSGDKVANSQTIFETESKVTKAIDWTNILSFIYIIVVAILFLKFVLAITRILILMRKHEKIKLDKGILIIHKQNIAPFSWFNYIFISQEDYDRNGEIIVRHEQAHIASLHSLDLITVEIISMLQWYNPFIWFIKKELQDSHEYEADKLSIESGIDAKEYQLLLVKEAASAQHFISITNNFNQNKTKKRINMMLKEKSKPGNRWKYLAVLPLVAISITLFAQPKLSNKAETVSHVQSVNYKNIEGTWKLIKSNHHDLSKGQSSIKILLRTISRGL